ncbi:MAG: dethiobiotin synthase [Vampirovibrionales bacterium]|nr:dethiobiotin synthase [Vampirovibrionales bacterium]
MRVCITGTDTDVGKTLVSSWLCLHTGASYFKPVQSGCVDGTDSDTVRKLAQVPIVPEVYKLQAPLSPHAAAHAEGITIDDALLTLPSTTSLVVEGAGGLWVPINATTVYLDVMARWQLPTLVVARTTLGTINHTCLTLEALRHRGVPVLGVIMNGEANESNRHAIEQYGNTTMLAKFPRLENVTTQALKNIPLPQTLQQALGVFSHGAN